MSMKGTTHSRQVTILTREPYSSAVHQRFTWWKGPVKPLFTPFSLPPLTPNIVLKLLQLVHFLHNLDLLVFPHLSRFVLK
jgi:hypothetical protein